MSLCRTVTSSMLPTISASSRHGQLSKSPGPLDPDNYPNPREDGVLPRVRTDANNAGRNLANDS